MSVVNCVPCGMTYLARWRSSIAFLLETTVTVSLCYLVTCHTTVANEIGPLHITYIICRPYH